MGMDVYGRVPKNEEGRHFRANCWSWRPLCRIMWESEAADLLDEKTWESMAYNNGAGPQTGEVAEEMADLISDWLLVEECSEHGMEYYEPRQELVRHSDIRVDALKFLYGPGNKCVDEDYKGLTHSAYRIHKDHIKEFINFLRNCGGFQVW